MNLIPRSMAPKLRSLAKKFPIISVMGPRQAGKSTLVKSTFPHLRYLTLESPDTREFALSDPRGFLLDLEKGAILDEVQRAPELFSYLQEAVDAQSGMGKFILTGSQNFLLQEKITQSLAGRVGILKLLPFSLRELAGADLAPREPESLLLEGCYPPLHVRKIAAGDWYSAYVQTYLEKDVRQIKNISDLNTFHRFLRFCAARHGQILNLTSLANDSGLAVNTIKAWISILEASFILFLLKPYHQNLGKRLIKSPKLYFTDPGLAAFLMGIEKVEQVKTHALKGALFEGLILSDFLKERYAAGRESNLYYWRDIPGNEVDCILEHGGQASAVEIKSGKTLAPDYFGGLKKWAELSNTPPSRCHLVYGGKENQKREAGRVWSWIRAGEINAEG